MKRVTNWARYGECPVCPAGEGQRCFDMRQPHPWLRLKRPHMERTAYRGSQFRVAP